MDASEASPSGRRISLRRQGSASDADYKSARSKIGIAAKHAIDMMPLVLLVVFVFLPQVSRTLFSAWDCKQYTSSYDGSTKGYLRDDERIECGSDDHNRIITLSIIFIIVWPVGMQVLFFATLWFNRKALREGRSNAWAKGTRFLTGGYKRHVFYWETVELLRRLACSGWIMLIPHEFVFARILMALGFAFPIIIITTAVRPCIRPEDNALSILSQALIIFSFEAALIHRIVQPNDFMGSGKLTSGQKDDLLGFSSVVGIQWCIVWSILVFCLILGSTSVYKLHQEYKVIVKK
jgi:hypothetical protein